MGNARKNRKVHELADAGGENMEQTWIKLLILMVGSSLVKYLFYDIWIWVFIDLAVLAIAYYMLKDNPYIDIRKTMLLLGGFTLISILTDVGVLNALLGQMIMLAVLFWMFWRRGKEQSGGGGQRSFPRRHKWHK
jgi:hypothetical protein